MMEEFLAKIKALKEEAGVDLSTAEDLSLAVMNLVSLEEHFYFTAVKTDKDAYFDTALEVRELRKKLLAELLPHHEGETWCAAKHLLAATMRLIEVGNKLQATGDQVKAKTMFERAYKVYAIFWALKLKLVAVGKAAPAVAGAAWSLKDLTSKLAECCDE
jgi:hypothetical protein